MKLTQHSTGVMWLNFLVPVTTRAAAFWTVCSFVRRPSPIPYNFASYTAIHVKNCSVYIQCKGDIVVVDIKKHKSQFKNSNFTITQSAKFF